MEKNLGTTVARAEGPAYLLERPIALALGTVTLVMIAMALWLGFRRVHPR